MTSAPVPERVRVRVYQTGFGESVLVTVEYAASAPGDRVERHILFDLGSTRPREGVAMTDVANLVAEHTNGQLDVLVVTHRHKDHLSGFGDPRSAPILAALSPRLVLRPWTEDPRLADDATAPSAGPDVGAASRRFAARLSAAQEMAGHLAEQPASGRGARRLLAAAASDQQPNQAAIATLDAMAADQRGRYLCAGASLDLDDIVPGMKVTVLGPPTIEQHRQVTKQVSRDPEYWMLRLHRALLAAAAPGQAAAAVPGAIPVVPADVPPGPVRWLVEHLADHQTHSLTRLVHAVDEALNNTSLILLLEIGHLSMLSPGDAQIENWQYTLAQLAGDAGLRAKLGGISLYKVGHHGSRNGTPRSLHKLWTQRPPEAPRLTALMSTRAGVHGTTPATAVPRATLIEALRQVADLYSTDDLPEGQSFLEVAADASGGPFRLVQT